MLVNDNLFEIIATENRYRYQLYQSSNFPENYSKKVMIICCNVRRIMF